MGKFKHLSYILEYFHFLSLLCPLPIFPQLFSQDLNLRHVKTVKFYILWHHGCKTEEARLVNVETYASTTWDVFNVLNFCFSK